MLRRLDVLVAFLTLCVCILVGNVWLPSFVHRAAKIHRMLYAPRDIVMMLYIDHPSAALRSESWRFHDLDGYSRIRYTVAGPRGDATVTEPPSPRVDVPALFDAAKSLGLFHAPRGSGNNHLYFAARVGKVWNQHDVYFPSAVLTASHRREYHIDLSHKSAVSALSLLELQSTPTPGAPIVRYLAQVHTFGTPAFRAACEAARNQVEAEPVGRNRS